MGEEFEIEKVHLAQVRYNVKESKSIEIPPINAIAFAFLVEQDGKYVNILNPDKDYPVYDRHRKSTTNSDMGDYYVTKLFLAAGEEKEGPCYVLDLDKAAELFHYQKEVTKEEIENYVIGAKKFFVDRTDVLRRRPFMGTDQDKVNEIIAEDMIKQEALEAFFEECKNQGKQKQ